MLITAWRQFFFFAQSRPRLYALAMARPPCPRRIKGEAPIACFKPVGVPLGDLQEITLTADEWEALRLADCAGCYHAEAAACMGVSRQTFDRILRRARGQVACALVHGHALRIERAADRISNCSPGGRAKRNC